MTPKPETPWTGPEMVTLAASAVGRIDRDGLRGVTLCSLEEIAAMAGLLATLGIAPIPPGPRVPGPILKEE